MQENPHIEVFVHERGAPHMSDPSKLLASAGRLYGQDMDRLWGEFLPVPADRLRVLQGGERIDSRAAATLEVAYTPAMPRTTSAYFEPSSRIAFVGDTAGIRRGSGKYVMPPTPPPDIDLERWRASEARILAVGSRHAVPDALRSVPRRPHALPGNDGPARGVEPNRLAPRE